MLRRTEVLRDNTWEEIRFEDLKISEKFRLFDPPEMTPVYAMDSPQAEFIVGSQPYITEEGVWAVEVSNI
jgi:hypothetical protein